MQAGSPSRTGSALVREGGPRCLWPLSRAWPCQCGRGSGTMETPGISGHRHWAQMSCPRKEGCPPSRWLRELWTFLAPRPDLSRPERRGGQPLQLWDLGAAPHLSPPSPEGGQWPQFYPSVSGFQANDRSRAPRTLPGILEREGLAAPRSQSPPSELLRSTTPGRINHKPNGHFLAINRAPAPIWAFGLYPQAVSMQRRRLPLTYVETESQTGD